MEQLKQEAANLINEARSNASLPPLTLLTDSPLATAVDDHCLAMSKAKYTSPFPMSGQLPPGKYHPATTHHVSECCVGTAASDCSDAGILTMITTARSTLMDADKPMCLEKWSTGVVIGISVEEEEFRYSEVYVDQYMNLDALDSSDLVGSDVTLTGSMDPAFLATHAPYCVIVYHSPPPVPFNATTIPTAPNTYFDFTDTQSCIVWPWEIQYDNDADSDKYGQFTIPVSFKEVPLPGSYYVQVFASSDLDNIPSNTVKPELELPGDPAVNFVAASVFLNVPEPATSAFKEGDVPIEAGTIEERQACATAVSSSTTPDPLPIANIAPLAGLGLVVPQSSMDQHLFIPVERQESGTVGNLTFAFERIVGGTGTDDEATGVAGVDFVVVKEGESVEDKIRDGFELVDVDLCHIIEQESVEEKKGEDAEGGSAVKCYLTVQRAKVAATDAPFLVDLAVVYADSGFEMGGGFVSQMLPQCVCDIYQTNIFVCTKMEGEGKKFADLKAEEDAREANDGIQKQLDETSSVQSADQFDADEFSVDADMTRDEMLRMEEEREVRMRDEAERQAEEAEDRAKETMLLDLQESIEALEDERGGLTRDHAELQRKLAAFLANQKRRENTERANEKETMPAHEMEKQYNDTLTSIVMVEEKLNNQKSEYDKIAIDLQTRLDEKECKANEISLAFRDFKREISKGSENSRTGKPMGKKVIEQFEKDEVKKDEEAERVRLKNINLKMTLKKLENNLRAKEQLAEGLHLIDFEQLKIENQTLNEKIEERNEELHKLRKKNTTTVQVLTHIKEKLQAVQADNGVVREQLGGLDGQLGAARDRLNKLKREREVVRNENVALKQKQGFANSTLLVVDFETRKTKLQETRSQLAELMERHEILSAMAAGVRGV